MTTTTTEPDAADVGAFDTVTLSIEGAPALPDGVYELERVPAAAPTFAGCVADRYAVRAVRCADGWDVAAYDTDTGEWLFTTRARGRNSYNPGGSLDGTAGGVAMVIAGLP